MANNKSKASGAKNDKITIKTYTWSPPAALRTQIEQHLKDEERRKERRNTNIRELAIYLEGLSKGQGNIFPLGKSHLESLWEGLGELERDIK